MRNTKENWEMFRQEGAELEEEKKLKPLSYIATWFDGLEEGTFEFKSSYKAGTKSNHYDAVVKRNSIYGTSGFNRIIVQTRKSKGVDKNETKRVNL